MARTTKKTTAATAPTTSAKPVVETVETVKATVAPVGTAVTWESDQPTYATVENGVVTGKAAGTANITAKAGSQTATCAVTVSAGA